MSFFLILCRMIFLDLLKKYWNVREQKYGQVILTDVLEIYIIELNKLDNDLLKNNYKLKSWLYFIKNSEVLKNMRSEEDIKEIKKAEKILEDISADEHERWLAEMRLKYIRDKKAIEDFGYDKGYEQGMEKGMEKGIEQGITKKQEEMVKKLKERDMNVKFIEEVTGLTKEEIEKIK